MRIWSSCIALALVACQKPPPTREPGGAGSGSGTVALNFLCEPPPQAVRVPVITQDLGAVQFFNAHERLAIAFPIGDCPDLVARLPDFAVKIGDCLTCGLQLDADQIAKLEADLGKGKIDRIGTPPLTRITLQDRIFVAWDIPGVGDTPPPATNASPSGGFPEEGARTLIAQFFGAVQAGNICAPCTPPADCDTGPGGPRDITFTVSTESTCDPSCEQLRQQYCPTGTEPEEDYGTCKCAVTCCSQH